MTASATASSSLATHGPAVACRYDAGDARRPQGSARMSALLAAEGLALFRGADSRTAVLQAASALLTARPHPDADSDGITVITDLGASGDLPGAAGFSRRELAAHTDGSRVAHPPALLMAVCAQPAEAGGSSRLADGLAVFSDLAASCPQALTAFTRPRSVLFGGADGYLGSVLTLISGTPATTARLQLRLRLDDLVTFAPDLRPWLPALRASIARHTITVSLADGDGYVLDNHRWLHAREQFTGVRTLYRVLGDPLPSLGLYPGVPPASILADGGRPAPARPASTPLPDTASQIPPKMGAGLIRDVG
jgi:alpha-ketoglutarate-dependent taurine dioxygenase